MQSIDMPAVVSLGRRAKWAGAWNLLAVFIYRFQSTKIDAIAQNFQHPRVLVVWATSAMVR